MSYVRGRSIIIKHSNIHHLSDLCFVFRLKRINQETAFGICWGSPLDFFFTAHRPDRCWQPRSQGLSPWWLLACTGSWKYFFKQKEGCERKRKETFLPLKTKPPLAWAATNYITLCWGFSAVNQTGSAFFELHTHTNTNFLPFSSTLLADFSKTWISSGVG